MRSFRHGHSPLFRIFLRVSSLLSVCRSFRTHVPTHSCRPMKPVYAGGPDPNGFGGTATVSRSMPLFGSTTLGSNPLACKVIHQSIWAVPVTLFFRKYSLTVSLVHSKTFFQLMEQMLCESNSRIFNFQ